MQRTFKEIKINLENEDGDVPGITNGTSHIVKEERDLLSNIIKTLNEVYDVELSEEDKIDIKNMKIKLEENEELKAFVNSKNTVENIRYKFDKVVDSILLEFVHNKLDLYKKLTDNKVNTIFKHQWFDWYYQAFKISKMKFRI